LQLAPQEHTRFK